MKYPYSAAVLVLSSLFLQRLFFPKRQAGWLLFTLTMFSLIGAMNAYGQEVLGRGANGATANRIVGTIEAIIINDQGDRYSGGSMTIGGQVITVPRNMLIELPTNRLTLQELFAQAPADCIGDEQSGLAQTDTCASKVTATATVLANRIPGVGVIMGEITIQKGAADTLADSAMPQTISGVVTYINYAEGYFRINSDAGTTANPPTINLGTMVRLNDPHSVHTIQKGLGCLGGNTPSSPNCSADPRFANDPLNYTHTFTTGYPLCIPSTTARGTSTGSDANGVRDALCPQFNRPANPTTPVHDSRFFAPIKVGDWIQAKGNIEIRNNVRFFSAHTATIGTALVTRNAPDQPDYMLLRKVEWEVPGFLNWSAKLLMTGTTTLPPRLEIYSIHHAQNNARHETPLASTVGCDIFALMTTPGHGMLGREIPHVRVPGVVLPHPVDPVGVILPPEIIPPATCTKSGNNAAGIFEVNYEVDFTIGSISHSPCTHLLYANIPDIGQSIPTQCGTDTIYSMAEDFAMLSPTARTVIGRTRHKLTLLSGIISYDINGRQTPNGEYLKSATAKHPAVKLINLHKWTTPFNFEGVPWNLDRRLGPSGCAEQGCDPSPVYHLDPFPCSGLNPLHQVITPDARRPLLSYVENTQLIPPIACQAGNGFNIFVDPQNPDAATIALAIIRTFASRIRVDGRVTPNAQNQTSSSVEVFNGTANSPACTGISLGKATVYAGAFSFRADLTSMAIPSMVCVQTELGFATDLATTTRP